MTKHYKKAILASLLVFIAVLVVMFVKQTGIAPSGIHGCFSSASRDTQPYETLLEADSLLKVLQENGISVKTGRLNSYDPSWDSLRYVLGNISCDGQRIEAYVEFVDRKAQNTTLSVIWFNAEPTEDDEEYRKRAEAYYECFEALLKTNNLIKRE